MARKVRKTTTNRSRKKKQVTSDSESDFSEDDNNSSFELEDDGFVPPSDKEEEEEERNRTPVRPAKKMRTSFKTPNGTPSVPPSENSEMTTPRSGRRSIQLSSPASAMLGALNDDEQEKKRNKRKREQERRRKSIFASNTDFISASTAPISSSQNSSTNDKENRVANATHTLTSSQLEELFKNCMKLSTENKINVKNTWSLNLIDYIDEVITSSTVGENEISNFQVASCTLDASVKIYSYRVDSVHSETYKVLGGLSRADSKHRRDQDGDENEESENTGSEDTADGTQKKQTKKRQHGSNTLEQNINNLNVKKFEYAHSIEPLYYKTSGSNAQYDVGSAESLLLNNLYMSESSELILDAAKYNCVIKSGQKERIDESVIIPHNESSETTTQQVEIEQEGATTEQPDSAPLTSLPDNNEACQMDIEERTDHEPLNTEPSTQDPESTQYHNQGVPTQGIENSQHVKSESPSKVASGEAVALPPVAVFDKDLIETTIMQARRESELNNDHDFGGDGGVTGFDDNAFGAMLDHADDSDGEECLLDADFNNDIQDEAGEGEVTVTVSAERAEPQTTKNPVAKMFESDQLDFSNEYSFINPEKVKGNSWAGADHWTFTSTRSKRGNKSKSTTSKKRKRATKNIDFLTEPDHISKKAFELDKNEKKSTISMAERTIKTAEKKNYLLPEDVHYDIISLEQPFNLPSYNIRKKRRIQGIEAVISTATKNDASSKNKDNENDDGDDHDTGFAGDFGFGGDGGLFDDDDMDNGGETLTIMTDQQQQQSLTEASDVLTDPTLPILSSATADGVIENQVKLIDVPRMVEKLNIKYATRAKKVDVKALKDHLWEAFETSTTESIDETRQFSAVVSSLRDVTKQKSQQKVAGTPDFSDVSVPFCFICLLHLANEKGLEITGKEDLSDFSIKHISNE